MTRPCPECGRYGDHHPLCPNIDDETSGETREPDDEEDDIAEDDE